MFINDWNSETSYSGNETHILSSPAEYFKIRNNSSTWDFLYSPDGLSWATLIAAKTAFSTYDQIGFGFHSNQTGWASAVHWFRVR